jgi:hypothetical protein
VIPEHDLQLGSVGHVSEILHQAVLTAARVEPGRSDQDGCGAPRGRRSPPCARPGDAWIGRADDDRAGPGCFDGCGDHGVSLASNQLWSLSHDAENQQPLGARVRERPDQSPQRLEIECA